MMMCFTAISTQSLGVPPTAKRRGTILCSGSGRRRVRPWLAPLCSASGAITHTSLDSERATRSRIFRPGAWMPSSLETRMRALDRSLSGTLAICFCDSFKAVHVRAQHCGNGDRSILLLIVFEDGDQRAPDRKAGAIERVDEARTLLARLAAARLHAPRLELAAVGAARDLAIGVLAGQPDLDVKSLLRREAHVAGAQRDDAVRQAEALQHFLGAIGHALVLFIGMIRMRD